MFISIKNEIIKLAIWLVMARLGFCGVGTIPPVNEPIDPPAYVQEETQPTEPENVGNEVGEKIEQEDIAPSTTEPQEPVEPQHTHNYETKVVSPSCYEKGYTVHSCACGFTYNDGYVDELEHEYNSEVIAPTTEAQGYTKNVCTRCGHTYKDNYTEKLPSYKEVNETVYVTGASSLNVRTGPGTGYEKIGTLSEREATTRVGVGDNGWSQIMYNGNVAYVSSNYLTTTKPAEPLNLSNYNPIRHNYTGLTAEDVELINQVLAHCEQYANGEISDPKKVITVQNHSTSMERVSAYFIMEFASNPSKNALYRLGEVNISGEPTKYIITIDATNYSNMVAQKRKMDNEIDRVLKTFKPGTEEEMLRQCADYLRSNLSYQAGASVGSEALFTGKANCDAFAQLFMKMSMRLGIQCDWCHGTANGGGHAWNRVTFSNGNVRYYDVCWYDGSGDTSYLNRSDAIHNLTGVNTIG